MLRLNRLIEKMSRYLQSHRNSQLEFSALSFFDKIRLFCSQLSCFITDYRSRRSYIFGTTTRIYSFSFVHCDYYYENNLNLPSQFSTCSQTDFKEYVRWVILIEEKLVCNYHGSTLGNLACVYDL